MNLDQKTFMTKPSLGKTVKNQETFSAVLIR